MKLFKKGGGDAPPDIGKEEVPEAVDDVGLDEPAPTMTQAPVKLGKDAPASGGIETERMAARVESISAMLRDYSDRFSALSQQIGEVRAMNLSNEKAIAELEEETARAIDIVKEVKPDKLRIDYQKTGMRLDELSEKLVSNRQFMDTIMGELKDLRLKVGKFVGSEALLRLNDDVKKELIQIQQLAGKSRVHSDKAEQIFIELSKGFAETQKVSQIMSNMDVNYAALQKAVDKLRLDFSNIVSADDFADYKKKMYGKAAMLEKAASGMEAMRDENQRLGRILETMANVTNQNKRDIADIAASIGNDHIKRVSDYDDKLASILEIMDSLAGEIAELKSRAGNRPRRQLVVKHHRGSGSKGRFRHLKVHPETSRKLSNSVPGIAKIRMQQARLLRDLRDIDRRKGARRPASRKSIRKKR